MPYKNPEQKKKYDREHGIERYHVFVLKCHEYLGETPRCVDCGVSDDLEISHNDPFSKSFNPLEVWSTQDWDSVKLELDKCSLRCVPCHLKYDRVPQHGTRAEYTRHGCRCDLCKSAHALYTRDYRARKKLELSNV